MFAAGTGAISKESIDCCKAAACAPHPVGIGFGETPARASNKDRQINCRELSGPLGSPYGAPSDVR
eukprot:scaffold20738_cov29-Tisochrysis_lutea.AAC.3